MINSFGHKSALRLLYIRQAWVNRSVLEEDEKKFMVSHNIIGNLHVF